MQRKFSKSDENEMKGQAMTPKIYNDGMTKRRESARESGRKTKSE